ncbi:MAG: hypothetical protein IH628_04775, partial [Proteobacteria bacterium]|nr:hypothetical protein [Pseudomonadota bacterium]
MVRILQFTAPRRAVFALLLALVFPVAASAQVEGLSELSDTDFIERFRTRISPDQLRFTSDPVRFTDGHKCSFHLMAEAARRLPLMSIADRQIMQTLLAAPATQTSVLSPSGRFRVHFDTTGKHAPAMLDTDGSRIPGTHAEYADSVAAIYDYVFAVEIGECGYERPPFEPGKNEYQVYIQEYGASPYYGETFYPTPIDDPAGVLPTYACYIQMDNDYSSHYSKGLDGARVTAAHEFYHVIQIGRYGLQANNAWMHEMTSSYYEEVVFPLVNDYIFYVRNFMREPDRPMHMMGDDGYDLVLWPLFLEQRFGPDILRRIWMDMQNGEPLSSMRQQIAMRRGDFSTEFCAWARSIYFTAWRTWRLDPPAYT